MCAYPTLKFSDRLHETHLFFFIWPKASIYKANNEEYDTSSHRV